MISGAISGRYARAFYELGLEANALEDLVKQVAAMAAAYETSAEMRQALDNPLVAHEAKRGILSDVAGALGLSPLAKNAIFFLSDRRRIRALPAIAARLRELYDQRRGVLRAEVLSAAPLGAPFTARLKTHLEQMTGKEVALDCKLDPSIIAGVVMRIGDTVYDGSIQSRLTQLKAALMPN